MELIEVGESEVRPFLEEMYRIVCATTAKYGVRGGTLAEWEAFVPSRMREGRRVMIFSEKGKTVGFFMYELTDDALVVNELHVAEKVRARYLWLRMLANSLKERLPPEIVRVRAGTNRRNGTVLHIAGRLGLSVSACGENHLALEGDLHPVLRRIAP